MEAQSSEKTFDESVEDKIHQVLEENLSLVQANTFVSTDDAEEISEIDVYDNEENKLDEAAGGKVDVRPHASQDTVTKVNSVQHDVAEASKKRSQGLQVKWAKTHSRVIPTHIRPSIKQEMPLFMTDDKNYDSKMYGGAKPRPSRLSSFLRETQGRSFNNDFEDPGEGNVQKILERNLSLMASNDFFSDEDPNKIKKIDSYNEDCKSDEVVGGAIDKSFRQRSAQRAKGNRLQRRQVRWGDGNSFIPNHDRPGSEPKSSKSNERNDNSKNKRGSKKSRFSCFFHCFNPKVLHDDDDNDSDDLDMTSIPRASIRGNIEDNMFNRLFSPVAFINGFNIKLVNNVMPKESYFFKTDGIFYDFSNRLYVKMEIILKKKIYLRPAGQFYLFISNPNNNTVNEIEIDYNVTEMPNNSMLISRQIKFDPKSHKKLAVLDLRYYKSRRHSTYLYNKLRLILDRCGDGDCPFLIQLDRHNLKYDIFSLK